MFNVTMKDHGSLEVKADAFEVTQGGHLKFFENGKTVVLVRAGEWVYFARKDAADA